MASAASKSSSECLVGALNSEEHIINPHSAKTAVENEGNNVHKDIDEMDPQTIKALEIEDLIAELCLTAPSDPVKFCLRLYQYGKQLSTIESDIFAQSKTTLIETAEYLLISFNDTVTKKILAHDILCRIQNLLPDNCNLCNQRYRIKLNEKPILECEVCYQGVHTSCWTELIHAKSAQIHSLQLDHLNIRQQINPLNIPGMHYMCQACEHVTFSLDDPEEITKAKRKANKAKPTKNPKGKKQAEHPDKKKTTDAVSSLPNETANNKTNNNTDPVAPTIPNIPDQPATDINGLVSQTKPPPNQFDTHEISAANSLPQPTNMPLPTCDTKVQSNVPNPRPVAQSEFAIPPPERPGHTQQTNPPEHHHIADNPSDPHIPEISGEETSNLPSTKFPIICRFFKKGSCKHGVKGLNCKFQHPAICEKFTQHGTRKPRGCNLGRNCKNFHPQVCINSLRSGKCYDSTCKFNHISGTKREPPSIISQQQTTRINPQHQHQQNQIKQNNRPITTNDGQIQIQQQNQSNTNNEHFLGLIRLMKAEIMQAMESKLTSLMSKVQSQNPYQQYPPTLYQSANNPSNQLAPMQSHIPRQFNNSQQLQNPYQQANNVPQPFNNNVQTSTSAITNQMQPNVPHPIQPPSLMSIPFQMPPKIQATAPMITNQI